MAAKRWKDSEIDYLKRYARSKTLKQLVQRFSADAAAVAAKLAELDLTTKDGKPDSGGAADPVLAVYEEAVREAYKGRWKQAASLFEKVMAESDQPELSDRARQYLAACRRRLLAATGDGGDADPYLAAVLAKNRGDLDEALAICKEGGRAKKDERFAFLAASLYALTGREEEAAQALAQAVELNPKNRVHAFHDPDFAALRGQKELAHLFGLDG
jgi:tetratricopeptide (TPR) repeat protein